MSNNFLFGPISLVESRKPISQKDSAEIFRSLYQDYEYKMLLESKDVSPIYGRMSLIGVDPILHLQGKDDTFEVESLNDRGKAFLKALSKDDFDLVDEVHLSNEKISGTIKKQTKDTESKDYAHKKNVAQVIRIFLEKFKTDENCPLGFFGAFAYDFVRLFEDIGNNLPGNETPDFNLFLYDTFIRIDHIRETSEIIVFRDSEPEGVKAIEAIETKLKKEVPTVANAKISEDKFIFSKSEYEDLVQTANQYILEGEIFEVVFANTMKAKFSGDPFTLYLKYREANPSPYMFYFDFGDEQLVGASPEMMVRCEDGEVNLRPISGTSKRGKNPIEDHENMLELLNSEKERAELDMLVDLGRNDLTRVCKPGIEVSDYRFVEKYSKVMHTVTHLTGHLQDECTAFDALVSTLNNGTLTGAPKVRAMAIIEQHEKQRRGYYGGAVGYLTFSGNMDTGITIRTAHIRDNELSLSAGASIVYDSIPENEYQETLNKAAAFLSLIDD